MVHEKLGAKRLKIFQTSNLERDNLDLENNDNIF